MGTLSMGIVLDRDVRWPHRLLAAAGVLLAMWTATVPHVVYLIALFGVMGLAALCAGALDIGGNILLVYAWGREDDGSSAAMTGLHFAWGVGAACAPVMAAGLGLEGSDMVMVYSIIPGTACILMLAPLVAAVPAKRASAMSDNDGGWNVGTISVCSRPSLPILWSFWCCFCANVGEVALATPFLRSRFVGGMCAMTFYYFAYATAEQVPGAWLATYAVHSDVDSSDAHGAYVTSVYWASLTLGRLVAAVTALRIADETLMRSCFAACGAGCVVLIVVGQSSLTGLYVAAAFLGLGLSALFPMGILLARSRLPVRGKWISRFIAGSDVGSITMPALVGFFVEDHPSAFVIAQVASLSLLLFTFIAMTCLPRLKDDKA